MLGAIKNTFFHYIDYIGQYNAVDVACYLVNKANKDGQPISNLQLQKILYYIQVYFLQNRKYALFKEDIEAWRFGPVVRSVYNRYRGFGASDLFETRESDINFSAEEKRVIDGILSEKSKQYPWSLVADIHKKGKAWDITYRRGKGDKTIISKEVLARFG